MNANAKRLPTLVVLLLALIGVPLATQAETPSVRVETVAVTRETLVETLDAFGRLDPDPDQVLSLSLSHAGLISRVWVRLGQRVKSGDRLLEVVTAPDAYMQYLQAKSAADFARRELDRQQRLLGEQLATKAQVDAAAKALQDANTALDAVKQRGQGVEKETLRAPMDGIVTRLDVSQGQRVQADSTAMLIAAEQRLIARLGIEPEDLARVQPGTPVVIRSVFAPELAIPTKIREVHAMIDPTTRLVEVLAPIPAEHTDGLVLGSRVTGRLKLGGQEALVVPRRAVLPATGPAYVYRVVDGKAQRVAVTRGVEVGDRIAVSGPLEVGDTVVVSGNYELTDGMAVRETP